MQVVITSLQHTREANISMRSGLLPWTLLWHPYFRSCFRRVRHDSAEYKDFIATSIINFWEQKCHLSSLRRRDKKIIGQFYLKQLLTNMPIYQLAKFLLQSSIQHELILFKSSTVISAAHYSWNSYADPSETDSRGHRVCKINTFLHSTDCESQSPDPESN